MPPKAMQTIRVIGALPYESVRERCHQIKDGICGTIHAEAQRLAKFLPVAAVLIPVPGHRGYPDYTDTLAFEIVRAAQKLGKEIKHFPVLLCQPHPSFCQLKHDEKKVLPEIRMKWSSEYWKKTILEYQEAGYDVILVDNVIDTGKTARACMSLLGPVQVLATGDTGRHKI